METIQLLMQKSAGVGAGVAIGASIGFLIRRHRKGDNKGLIAESIFVTSAICGMVAMGVMMLITYFGGF